ncbi:hypothetical protein C8034_v004990 [Colletotrichum sidae]|uniref:Uncharacterized protein n=1 Tax=Colletotrichum sidae TaxID=1347389 RepID=A0A4R8T7I0_9PEZI|nr:hypothetical protein C8034_v004990 [Colletotrichum sidae]
MSDDPDGIEIRNNNTKSAVVDVISDHTFACSGPCAQVDAMIAKMMKLIDCDLELTFSAVVKIGYKDGFQARESRANHLWEPRYMRSDF